MLIRTRHLHTAAVISGLAVLLGCSSASELETGSRGQGSAGGGGSAGAALSQSGGSGPSSVGGSGTHAGSAATSTAGTAAGGGPGGAGSEGGAPSLAGAPGSGGGGGGASAGAGSAAGMASQGGMGTSGGSSSQGGSGHAGTPNGGASSGGGSNPNDKTIPMTIPTPSNGQGEIREATTVLKNGANGGKDVWDFNNQRIGVKNTEDCEDGEGQLTVFEVEDGITVRNLIVAGGIYAGNGIVCKGNCTLEYVYWEDVCEDAATNSKDGATMRLNHVIALKATDKVFQHNAKGGSKTILQNSYVSTFGKLWRSCGDCTANGGPRHLEIDNVRVEGISTAVAGANQNYGDTVTIKNLFVKGGYDSSKDKPKICTEYLGVTDHNGESTKLGEGKSQWNTATCKVNQSDVKSY